MNKFHLDEKRAQFIDGVLEGRIEQKYRPFTAPFIDDFFKKNENLSPATLQMLLYEDGSDSMFLKCEECADHFIDKFKARVSAEYFLIIFKSTLRHL